MISILHKTKQKQISKIEKTNILIENPKTQNKNESNLNPFNKKKKKKKEGVLRCIWNNLSQFNWQHGLRILE